MYVYMYVTIYIRYIHNATCIVCACVLSIYINIMNEEVKIHISIHVNIHITSFISILVHVHVNTLCIKLYNYDIT